MIWIEVITIGGEILSGRTRDSNFAFLANGLAAAGLACRRHTTVGDDREPLAQAIEEALARADVVLTTGGLGPTPDDITRKVLATVLKRQLVLREDVVATLEERYARMGRIPPANFQAQALIPLGADLIENEIGTAPGIRIGTQDGRFLYAMPGVPHEMERMAARFVLPEIARAAPGPRRASRTVRTVGLVEMKLVEILRPIVPPEVSVAYLPNLGKVDLRFDLEGETAEAEAILERLVGTVRERLGPAVYAEGEEDLEEVVGRALVDRGWKLAVAESLTGGGIGRRLVRVAGASRYLLGDLVAYDNGAKVALLGVPEAWIREHGAVSGPVAEAMASGARERFGADLAVATTGIAGPEGGTVEKPVGLVYFGLAWAGGRVSIRRHLAGGGGREPVLERTTTVALDLVRRAALDLPIGASD